MLRLIVSVEQAIISVKAEIQKVISGQHDVIDQCIAAILCDGHILLEGVPGLGKTLLVRTIGKAFGIQFGRIQFTPDLMPSDVTGTMVFDAKTSEFAFRPGPIFAGLLLADEINRTPPKAQSALLEAMEERSVTIDGTTHSLPKPFIVFATQNPIESEGTYPLPEAQQDRFLMKVILSYPSSDQEIQVLRAHNSGFTPRNLEASGVQQVINLEQLTQFQAEVKTTKVEEKNLQYIYDILKATRQSRDVILGASTRAGIALLNVGKSMARVRGRDFVIPDDIKEMAPAILRHRLQLRPEAEVEGQTADDVIVRILDSVPIPR